jgi:hypothetical protein
VHRHRPQGALHAIGREQLVGGQQRGQDGRVRRVEERLGRAEDECDHGQVPQLQRPGDGQCARRGRRHDPCALHDEQDDALGQPVGGYAAEQRAREKPNAGCGGHDRQLGRAPPSAITWYTTATSHNPLPNREAAIEATRSRYSRWRNGRIARGSRRDGAGAPVGCSVITVPRDYMNQS